MKTNLSFTPSKKSRPFLNNFTRKNDYNHFIQELHLEIATQQLTLDSKIQILRSFKAIHQGNNTYYPIVDWYYDEVTMDELFEQYPLSELTSSVLLYIIDQPYLEEMTVKNMLKELETGDKLR